jgi:hypothetical protein
MLTRFVTGLIGAALWGVLAAALLAELPGKAPDRLFHKPGLLYFWALNDDCSDAKMERFVEAFVQGGAAAVCLHPRPGLLKPYGGEAWFAFVTRTVDRCAARGLDVWLYDEDHQRVALLRGRRSWRRSLWIWADGLEVAADGLAMAEGDGFAFQHGFRQLLVLPVLFTVSPLGRLLGFR